MPVKHRQADSIASRMLQCQSVNRSRQLRPSLDAPRSLQVCLHATSNRHDRHGSGAPAGNSKTAGRSVLGLLTALLGSIASSSSNSSSGSTHGSRSSSSGKATEVEAHDNWQSPTYILMASFVAVHALTHGFGVLNPRYLQLPLRNWHPWQLLTAAFMHSSFEHLAQNLFLGFTLGRVLERLYGGVGLWLTYLASAAGAGYLTQAILPAKTKAVVCTSSAGVFGIFIAGVLLPRMLRKPLEVACLAPLVCCAAVASFQHLAPSALVVDSMRVGQYVPLAGAAAASLAAAGLLHVVQKGSEQARERAEKERQLQAQAVATAATEEAVVDALTTAARAASHIAKHIL